jgi:hypothetical protein
MRVLDKKLIFLPMSCMIIIVLQRDLDLIAMIKIQSGPIMNMRRKSS